MGNVLLLLVVALTAGAVVFGVMALVSGGDPGLRPAEPDTRARPLPGDRPLVEGDVSKVSFDVQFWGRGYRMNQVDQTLRRLAYDLGYKSELIQVLEHEVEALREGRVEDADTFAKARVTALGGSVTPGTVADEPGATEAEVVDLDEVELSTDVEAAQPETDHEIDSDQAARDNAPIVSTRL